MQKFTGIDFITTYSPQIFGLAGYSAYVSTLLAGFNFVAYTFSLLLAVYLIDRVGRRKVMLWGAFLMGLFLAIAAILDYYVLLHTSNGKFPNLEKAKEFGAASAVVIYFYTCIFGSTWITAGWLYPTEIFPIATRAKGAAWSSFAFGIGNGVVVMIVPYIIQAASYYIFVIFAGCNFIIIPLVYFFYPETANRTLEEIDVFFTSKSVVVQNAEKEYNNRLLADTVNYKTIQN